MIFFLMNRRPPRSSLLPHPALFRTVRPRPHGPLAAVPGHGRRRSRRRGLVRAVPRARRVRRPARGDREGDEPRSEEHTPELKSRQYFVCGLLLEKKKYNALVYSTHL